MSIKLEHFERGKYVHVPVRTPWLLSLCLCFYFLVIIFGKAAMVSGLHVQKTILTKPFCSLCLVTLSGDMSVNQLFYCRTASVRKSYILLATGQFATVYCVQPWPHKRVVD